MQVNEYVKDFSLLDDQGVERHLSEFKGKITVIYFYPKDNTPGCTAQACAFRDNYQIYQDLDINVIGISKDSVKSHQEFKNDFNLPFVLLSDPDLKVINYFDVYKDKMLYGKMVKGVKRTTFILDEEHKVIKIFNDVTAKDNATEIIAYLKEAGLR